MSKIKIIVDFDSFKDVDNVQLENVRKEIHSICTNLTGGKVNSYIIESDSKFKNIDSETKQKVIDMWNKTKSMGTTVKYFRELTDGFYFIKESVDIVKQILDIE